MSRVLFAVCACAVLVAVAGCGAGDSRGPTTDRERFDVPDTVTSEEGQRPATPEAATPHTPSAPGVAADGVDDPEALARAHARRLGDVSYTVERRYVERYPNGTVRRASTIRLRVENSPGRYRVERTLTTRASDEIGPRRVELFVDGDRRVLARTWSNRTEYGPIDRPEFARSLPAPYPRRPFSLSFAREVRRYIRAGEVTTVERVGRPPYPTVFRLEADRYDDPETIATGGVERVENGTLEAYATPEGVVYELQANYTAVVDGVRVGVVVSIGVSEVGWTRVDRPEWYERAVAAENGSATGDGRIAIG